MDPAASEHRPPVDWRARVGDACVPGVLDVQSAEDGLRITFREADFVIRLSGPGSKVHCETEWEVTVREALPGLSTWWGRWHRAFPVPAQDAGPLVAGELEDAIERVRAMLDDHARALSEPEMQQA